MAKEYYITEQALDTDGLVSLHSLIRCAEIETEDGEVIVSANPAENRHRLEDLKELFFKDETQFCIEDLQTLIILQYALEQTLDLAAVRRFVYFDGNDRDVMIYFGDPGADNEIIGADICLGYCVDTLPENIFWDGFVTSRVRYEDKYFFDSILGEDSTK